MNGTSKIRGVWKVVWLLLAVLSLLAIGVSEFSHARRKSNGLACEENKELIWAGAVAVAMEQKWSRSTTVSIKTLKVYSPKIETVCRETGIPYADFSVGRGPICSLHGTVTNTPDQVTRYLTILPR